MSHLSKKLSKLQKEGMVAFSGVMVNKVDYQIFISEFESHWIPLLYSPVLHLSNKLTKLINKSFFFLFRWSNRNSCFQRHLTVSYSFFAFLLFFLFFLRGGVNWNKNKFPWDRYGFIWFPTMSHSTRSHFIVTGHARIENCGRLLQKYLIPHFRASLVMPWGKGPRN